MTLHNIYGGRVNVRFEYGPEDMITGPAIIEVNHVVDLLLVPVRGC